MSYVPDKYDLEEALKAKITKARGRAAELLDVLDAMEASAPRVFQTDVDAARKLCNAIRAAVTSLDKVRA